MFIEAVLIRIVTKNGQKYGRFIPFLFNGEIHEFNMIYAENTLGKSTLIESIIYGLNGEDIYGQQKGGIINYKDILRLYITKEPIINAEVFLQLKSQELRIVIMRDALNWSQPVVVFEDIHLEEEDEPDSLFQRASKHHFFKIRKDKGINGNKTYQDFLFDFMNISTLTAPTDEVDFNDEEQATKDERLMFYIQNLMPLFAVQQGAWHDIQAINPRYGIPEIKKTAFEMILKLSGTEAVYLRSEIEKFNDLLKSKKSILEEVEQVLGLLSVKSIQSVEQEIKRTNELIDSYRNKLIEMEHSNNDSKNVIAEIREKFRKSSQVYKRYQELINTLDSEIDEYTYYINKIVSDIEKYDKLKTAKKLIGTLPIEMCPHCMANIKIDTDQELLQDNCGLCGSPLQKIGISENEQYMNYLKDELKDFEGLRKKKQQERKNAQGRLVVAELEQAELKSTLETYEEQLTPKNLQQYSYYSRETGRLVNQIKQFEKDKEIINRYDALLDEIKSLNEQVKGKRKALKALESNTDQDENKLIKFEEYFKANLKALDFLKKGLDENKIDDEKNIKNKAKIDIQTIYDNIQIDRDNYLPKTEGKNLYYLTSSSGLIRIILSYYVALLMTALEFKEDVNHPFLLIMDEPRQQNLDMHSFNEFMELLKGLKKNHPKGFQVIIASSERGNCEEKDISLNLGKEYLIKEM
ncbi:AAA family ATPase [Paenibacillus tengchongensis]|uniref:AAA family ATPase n=1 Tax=Paenibacillus tengchongensis TaxID=2608684 RepID=UPI00124D1B10|nr:AAA family ATPase [Paenibacillus tengchongensis]